jgi:hypothetical protein
MDTTRQRFRGADGASSLEDHAFSGSAEELKERPTTELIKALSQQTSELIRKEIELAKAELAEKGKTYGAGAGMFGGAGLLALLATGTFTTCLVAALATGMPTWLAALIVTVVYGVFATGLALVGKEKTDEASPPVPEQTIESVKEDVEWVKTRTQSAGR